MSRAETLESGYCLRIRATMWWPRNPQPPTTTTWPKEPAGVGFGAPLVTGGMVRNN